MPAVHFVVYELQGKSLQAVKQLYTLLIQHHKANPVDWQGKNLLDIRNLADAFYTNFFDTVKNKHPQIFATAGMDQKQIQIQDYKGGVPRAYTDRPAIYASTSHPAKIYMYCPVDYKDQHFIPEDAVRQTEAQAEKIGQLLWAGGWSDPVTIIPAKRAGTGLPADFDPAKHGALETRHLASDDNKPYRFFRAGGQSLALLDALDQAKDNYSKRVSQLFKALDALKTRLFDAGAIKGVQAASEFYFNSSLGTDSAGRPVLQISARREGTGQVLNIAHNPWFKAHGKTGGEYLVAPETGNPDGLAFKAFFDAIPDNPEQQAFPKELLSTDKVDPVDHLDGLFGPLNKPLIRHFPDGIYLAYRLRADGSGAFIPPGCTEISQAEFLWKDADENDRNMGTTLPPSPWAKPANPVTKPEI